jgi:hypothetical protein
LPPRPQSELQARGVSGAWVTCANQIGYVVSERHRDAFASCRPSNRLLGVNHAGQSACVILPGERKERKVAGPFEITARARGNRSLSYFQFPALIFLEYRGRGETRFRRAAPVDVLQDRERSLGHDFNEVARRENAHELVGVAQQRDASAPKASRLWMALIDASLKPQKIAAVNPRPLHCSHMPRAAYFFSGSAFFAGSAPMRWI